MIGVERGESCTLRVLLVSLLCIHGEWLMLAPGSMRASGMVSWILSFK